MSDLLAEQGPDWVNKLSQAAGITSDRSRESSRTALSTSAEAMGSYEEVPSQSIASRESYVQRLCSQPPVLIACRRPPSWMTLDELLDKLLFVAVSDDGESFAICIQRRCSFMLCQTRHLYHIFC